MPQTIVRFYADVRTGCPLIDWLDAIPAKARDKCVVRLERLAELGHELRRPEADLLRDGIYEAARGLARRKLPHALLFPRTGNRCGRARHHQRAAGAAAGN
jgi:hypothetical protein